MRAVVVGALALILVRGDRTSAQSPKPVTLGWGVDTSTSPEREIARTWIAYLRNQPERLHPSPYWSASEQRRWPDYDLTRRWVYQGHAPTIVEISAIAPNDSSAFVVKTLWASSEKDGTEIRPLALQRVYATRTSSGWRLENALPRLTADWRRERAGPIAYVVEPGAAFDQPKADGAATFMRDLAQRFAVPLPTVEYYLARTPESLARIIGLDWFGPGTAGRAYIENRQVFSGSPAYGPAYLHELVHIVLSPVAPSGTYWLAMEGLAAWLGGSRGLDFDALMKELSRYQREHPKISLQDVWRGERGTEIAQYGTAALFYRLVYERKGDAGVRTLAAESRDEPQFHSTLRRLLDASEARLDSLWRSGPLRLSP